MQIWRQQKAVGESAQLGLHTWSLNTLATATADRLCTDVHTGVGLVIVLDGCMCIPSCTGVTIGIGSPSMLHMHAWNLLDYRLSQHCLLNC